jgi:ABC-type multidrug transport system fused ATPase/permease subunit
MLRFAWDTDRVLVLSVALTSLVTSLTPAGTALAGRGLINTLATLQQTTAVNWEALIPWLALGLGLALVDNICDALNVYCSQRLAGLLNTQVNLVYLQHAAQMEIAFFENVEQQNLSWRAQNHATNYISRLIGQMFALATALLQTLSLVGILVWIEPLLLVVIAPVAGLYGLASWRMAQNRYQMEVLRTTRRRWMGYFIRLLTEPSGLPELKLLNLAPVLLARLKTLFDDFNVQDRELLRYNLYVNLGFDVSAALGMYMLLARVGWRVLDGWLTLGDVAIYTAAALRLRSALGQLAITISALREGVLFASGLYHFLNQPSDVNPLQGQPPPEQPVEIALENVTFQYPGGSRPVLQNITLHIRPGETIALVGENGAGKTTLVKLLAGLYQPSGGCIRVGGIDLKDVAVAAWQQQIGFVFQNFGVYEASAAENIAYGDWERLLDKTEEIEAIAQNARVDDLIRSLPQGYATLLGRRFGTHNPSQGQWQRLAVGRAFARSQAWLMILDEPAANLDARAEYELFNRFRELAAGRTTILISHRFSTVHIADRVIVLQDGQVVEQGSHSELLACQGVYAALYRFQTSPDSVSR